MTQEIIKNSLEYFDYNNERFKKIKKKIKYVSHAIADDSNIECLKLIFFDKNEKELFQSQIEILGKYYTKSDIWVWGWGLPTLNKYMTTIIRSVFIYGTDININNSEYIVLKNYLITSRFKISNNVQIEINCAIASYLSKNSFILVWNELDIQYGKKTEYKGESSNIKTDIIYYVFVLNPPNIDN